ncbi:fibronectin type III domain-containing protein [Pseudobdellovibrio exovorus]|uniref:Fibronectin type-III domain-containing protein n=1 Tax=Pseudobdellovibrio exovorus JSS TaxID=1184267 RepID=M4V7V5_9BACT|nr:fibronectin type III domain-containing protein [Pseudobdellovibrio exovorus]AGH94505.1 hypothetical protein A11Q_285 [Pseudobdellovibrio exovorus JSS]
MLNKFLRLFCKPVVQTLLLVLLLLPLSSCKNSDDRKGALVTWDANRESSVNSDGGGYKVYYSTKSGFDPLTEGTVIVVPHIAHAQHTPNKAMISGVPAGTYYVRVMAYSRFGTSDFSTEQSIVVPAL